MPKIIKPSFSFIGNQPILDFINTMIVYQGKPLDLLETFTNLLDWLAKSGILSQEEVDVNEQRWRNIDERLHVLQEARKLRSHLLTVVQTNFIGEDGLNLVIENINTLLKDQITTTKLNKTDKGFSSKKYVDMQRPLDIIAPIAETAVDFLCHYNLALVRKCENPECVLYFYDNSKNGTRRWCSQKTCGNRMKVTAFLERQRNK